MGITNVLKTLVTHPIQSFNVGVKTIGEGLQKKGVLPTGKTAGFVMPISTTPVKGAFSGTKSIISKGFNIAKNELLGAPRSFGQMAKSAVKGAAIATGLMTVGKYAATGRVEAPSPRAFAELVGLRAGPVSTIMGNIEGISENAGITANNLFDKFKQSKVVRQEVPSMSMIGVNDSTEALNTQLSWMKDQLSKMNTPTIGAPTTNLNLSMPSMPAMSVPSTPSAGFSFNPSVSAGGGMGEILPIMLLLAGGAGLAGYAVGKKRKKKRYKKKRKH